ncbi:hypothetical protein Tco_0337368 [Tanacetum coccineum]
MEERLVNGWIIIPRDFDEVKTKLKEACTQILELQKKHMGQRDKIAFVCFRISDLEMTLEDIQELHRLYMKNLMGHTSTSTSEASAMTHATIRKLVADRVATALEAQAATMAIINNPNKNSGPRKTPVARKCTHENELPTFLLQCNCAKKNKVKFAINTLTEEALFWWNSIAQPIGVEEAYKITWSEFKRLLIKKYCPQTEIKKMEEAITITQKLIEQAGQQVAPEALAAHAAWVKGSKEIDGLMLMTMESDIQRNLENLGAYEMLQELKTLFTQQAEQELLQTMREFHSCKVSLILISLRKEFDGFVQNYNMHSMGKIINELHAMLKLHEQTLPKNNAPVLHAIRAGKVQKGNNKHKKQQP